MNSINRNNRMNRIIKFRYRDSAALCNPFEWPHQKRIQIQIKEHSNMYINENNRKNMIKKHAKPLEQLSTGMMSS